MAKVTAKKKKKPAGGKSAKRRKVATKPAVVKKSAVATKPAVAPGRKAALDKRHIVHIVARALRVQEPKASAGLPFQNDAQSLFTIGSFVEEPEKKSKKKSGSVKKAIRRAKWRAAAEKKAAEENGKERSVDAVS